MCRMVHIRLRRDPKVVHPVPHPDSLSWDEAGNTYVSQSICTQGKHYQQYANPLNATKHTYGISNSKVKPYTID